ncbi:MAG: type IX secretion system protein PorQ [Flavobacteriales bacterium]|jgi:hypothetical protein|nr:type IX secretion system protein PorQ [Flavobacteriales bacterium]
MKHYLIIISFFTCFYSFSQIGGEQTYQFLNYTNSARVEGAGGYLIAIRDNDPSLGVENPALLNRSMHGYLVLDYTNQFAGANFGFSSYTKHYANVGTFNASLLYANYGKFDYANAEGILTGGSFTASDLALRLSYGRPISERFSVGANFNVLGSFYEQYNSFGISGTLGASYYNEEKEFSSGLLIKNIGYQLKSYRSNNKEQLPFNAVIAVSKKLAHAPFRFSFTYHNLQRFNLLYFDEDAPVETDPLTGEVVENKAPGFGKKLVQHIIIGGELILSDNFHIQAGYNHFVRTMSKVSAKTGAAGLSWGIGFKVKRFHLSYGMGKRHIAGANNHITISTNIGKQVPAEDTFYRQHQK